MSGLIILRRDLTDWLLIADIITRIIEREYTLLKQCEIFFRIKNKRTIRVFHVIPN